MITLGLQITGLEDTLRNLETTAPRVIASVERRLLRIIIKLQRYVITNKLSGSPLHQRTGNLIRNTIYSEPETSGSVISATVGVGRGAPYGAVHEFGGLISVPAQVRTSIRGKEFSVRAHTANYPERSFLRSSLHENESDIVEEIRKAVNEAL